MNTLVSTNEIREHFLSFFQKNEHEIIKSSSLVPKNDPTLIFTNAGMVQFKDIFTGNETRDYKRATSSQKCLRAGGKHNDLDNVGYTVRHHTFFEMLGNFSFGDYFKEDAIDLAWRMITKEYGIDSTKLIVTVHSTDDEAANIWKKVAGLDDRKIIRISSSDNFWAMGETGPCGPCTEIFYDHGDHIMGGPPGTENEDGDRFVEIWNLVFMQYEQLSKDKRISLPKPSVDTGMGLERITALLQGSNDNYSIDIFRSLIESSANLAGNDPDGPHQVSHRVIADHMRAITFLISDGVLPSNEGRGYVLRRIMRRAMRHAHLMGCNDPMLYKMVEPVIQNMGLFYPEISNTKRIISETINLEEQKFRSMLNRGLNLLEEETKGFNKGDELPGSLAFRLYDTFGFPVDLTQDALRSRGISVDMKGFELAMSHQRSEARKAWSGSGDTTTEKIWFDIIEKKGHSEFLGYNTHHAVGRIVSLIKNNTEVDEVKIGDTVKIISNQTPFYAESGGQVGDTGKIESFKGAKIIVNDTQKELDSLYVHVGEVISGSLKINDEIKLIVDKKRRASIRCHHSSTHLLHAALRKVLGDHVMQKGSLVNENRLRFDFSHPKPMSEEELENVEQIINQQLRLNSPVSTRIMAPKKAMDSGAVALFGEKYGEEVRVVSIGKMLDDEDKQYSIELCGGTHVESTGEIGFFKIIEETAVGSGARRIEALSGVAAENWIRERDKILKALSDVLKVASHDLEKRVSDIQIDRKKLEKEAHELRKKIVDNKLHPSGDEKTKLVGSISFDGRILDNFPSKDLKGLADQIKSNLGSGVVSLVSDADEKVSIVTAVTDDLTDKIDAVLLARAGSKVVGGKGGGGRADMAQSGGPDCEKISKVLFAIEEEIIRLLS